MTRYFSMKQASRFLMVTLLALATASCGFHLRGNYMLPEGIAKLSLTSFDPYGQLTRQVKSQFKMHGIQQVTPAKNVPNLNIVSESDGDRTLSLYQNNGRAEYELTYSVNYSVSIPNHGVENFTTRVTRTFLDNPLTALAKSVEEDELKQVMRQQAAQQIMRQLARLTVTFNKIAEEEHNDALADTLPSKSSVTTEKLSDKQAADTMFAQPQSQSLPQINSISEGTNLE
ncbi:hypothetical protein FA893_15630 [Photobacterium damselae subsp. piscicida]|nr:LPS assembly lipoprotein LptE [Photobacterium damselae]TFZ58247.1 hypothetical protein E4T25_10600 [Photobacterium damselae subsp. piscicida]TJZ86057.1 hypothetical protein FA893_15630 [Photobacterium damselae subsp. piscicida]BBC39664.1 LPS-assembly lipoprotein LptE [Photobacterium damselae subsp. piscicida]